MKKVFNLFLALFAVAAMYAANCVPVNETYLTSGLGDCTVDNTTVWYWDSYNYAKATAYTKGLDPGTANLFTPSLDLSNSESVTLTFKHTHKFAGTPSDEFTLWVTKDFKGTYEASSWQQLTIDPYGTNQDWNWVDVTIDVPVSAVGANTVFAFRYKWTSSNQGTWEIKTLKITSTCAGGGIAPPVPLPEVGEARLKVFAQNLRNYYIHPNTGRGDYTEAEIEEKTRKIVDAMMMVDADIFALCEVEAKPEVLAHLAESMNERVDGTPFAPVTDDIDEDWDASNNNNIKSGFIYRTDKVRPYGSNNAAAPGAYYYRNTLRIQVFEELETKERFTLSMNHFKAKDNTADAGNEKRVINANQVLNGLKNYASDPDILIVGDLNCEIGEEPITILLDAGYEELLVKYDADAYSHCYNGGELIDHALANTTMSEQITGAGVFHISTSCGPYAYDNYNYRYSDHDPYVVGVNLTVNEKPTECENIDDTYLTSSIDGMTVSGDAQWRWDNTYNCAKASKQGGYTGYMMTPEMNMKDMQSVALSFQHAHKYAGTPSEELTLWVTGDFQGSYETSSWQQLTINPYTSNTNFNFVDVKLDVPVEYVGENTVFAFKYMSTASNYATWEIKNLNINAVCGSTQVVNEKIDNTLRAIRIIENGQLYIILPDGTRYTVMGTRVNSK